MLRLVLVKNIFAIIFTIVTIQMEMIAQTEDGLEAKIPLLLALAQKVYDV